MVNRADRLFYLKASVIMYGVWILVFELIGRYAAGLPTRDVTIGLDRAIPFIAAFIWPYELCYVFPFLLLLVLEDWHRFNQAIVAFLLANVTAYVVYLCYPIAFPRPVLGTTLSDFVVALEYRVDFYPGANKLPSLHVAFAWIVFLACRKQRLSRAGDAAVFLTASLITAATLFVKQHIVLDIAAGVAWGIAAWIAAGTVYPLLANPGGEPRREFLRMIRKAGPAAAVLILLIVMTAELHNGRILPWKIWRP
jgi:membrane-associated phospholipid phosphatase